MPQMIFDDPDGMLGMLRDSVQTFASSFPGHNVCGSAVTKGQILTEKSGRGWQKLAGWA